MALKGIRNFIKETYLLLLLLIASLASLGQNQSNPKADFAHLDSLWAANKITKQAYIDSAEQNAIKYFSEGITLESAEYKKLLSQFYRFTDTRTIDTSNLIKYYNILENNASLGNRPGESFYYSNKILNLKSDVANKKFKLVQKKIQYYSDIMQFEKVGELYLSHSKIIDERVKECLSQDTITDKDMNVLFVLNFAAYGLAHSKDSVNLNKIEKQARILEPKYLNSNALKNDVKCLVLFLTRSLSIYKSQTFDNNAVKAIEQLKDAEATINSLKTTNDNIKGIIKENFNSLRLLIYVKSQQIDSAEQYLKLLDPSSGQISVEDYEGLSNLHEKNKNYIKAIDYQKKATESLKIKLKSIEEELDGLLLAYIDSEESKTELLKSEQENKNKTIAILVISFLAILVLLLFYVNMKKKERETKNRIETLNHQTFIQIAELEESKHQMQENLGRDLHDNLASLLAGIKHKIEYLQHDIEDKTLKSNLQDISEKMEEAYLRVRSKSHDLYQEGHDNSEQNFGIRIKQLIDFSLPDKHFEKDILIDNGAINQLNTDEKIELLKIIQEILTNIIKHAKASKISIVIYEDENKCNMVIKDNGKGYDTLKKSGLGIHSIQNRVKNMSGDITIQSDNTGTEISISIPYKNL